MTLPIHCTVRTCAARPRGIRTSARQNRQPQFGSAHKRYLTSSGTHDLTCCSQHGGNGRHAPKAALANDRTLPDSRKVSENPQRKAQRRGLPVRGGISNDAPSQLSFPTNSKR
eukprot:5010379-Pleurochrysis_carterae.AAC.1